MCAPSFNSEPHRAVPALNVQLKILCVRNDLVASREVRFGVGKNWFVVWSENKVHSTLVDFVDNVRFSFLEESWDDPSECISGENPRIVVKACWIIILSSKSLSFEGGLM